MAGLLQVGALLVALAAVYRPLGDHMARVFTSKKHFAVERVIYRLVRVNPDAEQNWKVYAAGVFGFSFTSIARRTRTAEDWVSSGSRASTS